MDELVERLDRSLGLDHDTYETLDRWVRAVLSRPVPGVGSRLESRTWYTSGGWSRNTDRRVYYSLVAPG